MPVLPLPPKMHSQSSAGPRFQVGEHARGLTEVEVASAAVVQLVVSRIDRGLVGLDACFELRNQGLSRLKLLPAAGTTRRELSRSIKVKTCFDQLRLIFELIRIRLRQRRLEGRGIDLRQYIAGVYI